MDGTTVTVGSVHELANILANMPPEQLQNVQLDPILYNALFQTMDSNNATPGAAATGATGTASATVDAAIGKGTSANTTFQSMNAANQLSCGADPFQTLQPAANANVSRTLGSNLMPTFSYVPSTPSSQLKITKPTSANQKLSFSNGNSSSGSFNTVSSYARKSSYQDSALFSTQSGAQHVSTAVTTTVMSHLTPTPSAHTVNLNNFNNVNNNNNINNNNNNKGLKPLQRPHVREKVNTNAHKQHNYNNNSPASQLLPPPAPTETIAMEDISALLQAVPDAQLSLLQAAVSNVQNNAMLQAAAPVMQNTSVEDTINSILSAPVAVPEEKGIAASGETMAITQDLLGHTNLQVNQNVSLESAAIVLSNEQLAELMSGKSVEEVLQAQNKVAGVGGAGLEMLQGVTPNADKQLHLQNFDPELPPLREIQMVQSGQTAPLNNNFLQQSNKSKSYYPSPASSSAAPPNKETFNKPNVLQRNKSKSTFSYDNNSRNNSATTTSFQHKEGKSAFSVYTKPMTSHTDLNRAHTGGKTNVSENQQTRQGGGNMGTGRQSNRGSGSDSTKPTWPLDKSSNMIKGIGRKNVVTERERITSSSGSHFPRHNVQTNKTTMPTPANVVKSGTGSQQPLNHANKPSMDLKTIGENHLRNSGVKSQVFEKKVKYPQVREREKNTEHSGGRGNAFNRSFKKRGEGNGGGGGRGDHHGGSSESKKRIKKTLKEMEKTYPKEVSEILHIREAIKSSHVGDGEDAMRNLAKLEIEKQLKRFSQKVNMGRNAEFYSKERKLDIRRRKNIDIAKTNLDKSNKSNSGITSSVDSTSNASLNKTEATPDTTQLQQDSSKPESDIPKLETDIGKLESDSAKSVTDATKTVELKEDLDSKDLGRKRERPKKFDDFVLGGSMPLKKDKKAKTRKFFFPEDLEDEEGNKEDEGVEKGSSKDGSRSETTDTCEEGDVSIEEEKMNSKKQEEILLKMKSQTPEVTIERLSCEKDMEAAIHRSKNQEQQLEKLEKLQLDQTTDQEPKVVSPKPSRPPKSRDLEERSFMDAISGDITPIRETKPLKPRKRQQSDNKENEKKDTSDHEDDDSEHCTAKDVEDLLQSLDVSGNDVAATTTTPEPTAATEAATTAPAIENDENEENEEQADEDEEEDDKAETPQTKTKTKAKKKKRKKTGVGVDFEPTELPQHLKRTTKLVKVQETVIDLAKVQMKSAYTESSFELNDTVELEVSQLLKRSGWVCTLCGKPGNIGTLDVLFGPYKVNVRDEGTGSSSFNVWMHRDCAIWTSTIYLNNQMLCGLGEALTSAAKLTCHLCTKVGATLTCSFRQCRDNYHYVCAKQRGCSFSMESFTITCPKHR